MERSAFDIRIVPSGPAPGSRRPATDRLTDMIDRGEHSGATGIYNQAGRNVVTGSLDGWRLLILYLSDDTLTRIRLLRRSVAFLTAWFGLHEKPDASGARYGFGDDLADMMATTSSAIPTGQRCRWILTAPTRYFCAQPDMTAIGEFLPEGVPGLWF